MLNKLEGIVNQIQSTESELQKVTKEVNILEATRLEQVLAIARKGLTFQRIITSFKTHNCDGNCYHNDRKVYSDLKGFKVGEIDKSEKDQYGINISETELWLLDNLTFAVTIKEGDESFYQGQWWGWNRSVVEEISDINIIIENWDVNEIYESIMQGLNKRLENLGKRTGEQKKRIEKLEKLKI